MYLDLSQTEIELQYGDHLQQASKQDKEVYNSYLNIANRHYNKLLQNIPSLEARPYQPEMAALYALRANNLCAGSCGLGKTLIVGLLICILYPNFKKPGQIQIAVPNLLSANSRWLIDLNRLEHLRGKVEVINSEKQLITSTKPIWVYTLDFIKRKSKKLKCENVKRNSHIRRYLTKKGRRPSLLVIDEIHLLKPNTLRTTHWKAYRRRAKRFLGLSGTISDGRLDLIYEALKITYGSAVDYTKAGFIEEFSANTKIKTNYLKGTEKAEEVTTRYLSHLCVTKLATFSTLSQRLIHRVTLNDPNVASVVTVPKHTNQEIRVLPHREHTALYIELIDELREKLDNLKQSTNKNLVFKVLSPLMQMSALPPGVPNHKLSKLTALLEESNGKTVIFGNFVKTTRVIYEHLLDLLPGQVVRLYANDPESNPKTLSSSAREDILGKFLFDPKIKVGIFSINLAAESIDLNTASQVIFYDYPWQSLKIQQALHRAVRPGSPAKHINVYYLVNNGMIDQHQYSLIKERVSTTKIMLDFDPTLLRNIDLQTIDYSKVIIKSLETDVLEQLLTSMR